MRRAGLLAAALVLLAGTARADQPIATSYDFKTHFIYHVGAPGSSPDPATAVMRGIDLNPTGSTQCILASSVSGIGPPTCSTFTGFTATGPLLLSGSVLSFKFTNVDLILTGAGALEVQAFTGAIVKAAGATTTIFGNFGPMTVLANSSSGTATPAPIGPATVGQVFQALTSSTLGFGPVQLSSIPGLAAIAGTGSANDLIAGTIPTARLPVFTTDVVNAGLAMTIQPNVVTFGKFQQLPGLSLLGVSGGSLANTAAITGTANNQVAQILAGSVQFHTFDYSQLTGAPPAVTAVTGAVVGSGPGLTATTFGLQSASSFFGVAGGSIAAPAPISCATPGTFAGNIGGTLGCTATIPATSAPLATGAIGYGSAGGLLTGDAANHHWDGTNFREGIREAAPAYQLHLVDEAGASDRGLVVGTHVTSNASSIVGLRKSRGSFASPAAVANTDYLGTYWHEGFDGTSWLRTAQTGAHVTPGGTVATGNIPTRWYVAVNPAGVTDPYGGTSPINIQTVSTPSVIGLLTSVGIGYPPGTSFSSLLSMRAVGLSGSGHNARMLLVNPTTGPDQGAIFTMTSDLTSATFTLNSNTSSAAAGINSLVIATTTSGGSIWLSPATLPMVEVVNPVHWGSTFESELAIHQIGTASNGGARATLRLLTDGDTQAGVLTQTQSGFTGWEGPNNLTLENLSAGVIQLSTNNSGVNTFAVEPSTSGASSVVQGAALARSATGGMFNIATMPGSPTGTPTVYAGTSPLVVDSTNHALDFNVGGTWYALTPSVAGLPVPGSAGLVDWTGSAAVGRTLINSDGTINFANADGVAGNPEIHVNAIPESKVTNLTADLTTINTAIAGKQPTGNYITGVSSGPVGFSGFSGGLVASTINLGASGFTGALPLGDLALCSPGQVVGMVGGVQGCVTPSVGTIYTGMSPIVVNAGTGVISCPTCGTSSGSVTGVFGTTGQIAVSPSSPNPIVSLVAKGAGAGTYGGSGIAGFSLDAFGAVTAVTPATYLTSTGTTPGTYNNITTAASGLITGASVTSWMTAGAIMKSGGLAALPVAATSGDLAGAIGMPVLNEVDVSGGPAAAPYGDPTFAFDPSTHTLDVNKLNVASTTTLGDLTTFGAVTFSGYAGGSGGTLRINGSGFMGVGSNYTAATIDYTTTLVFNGPSTPAGWLVTASPTPGFGQIGQIYEYPKQFAASTATLKIVVVHNSMDGSGDVAINITRNGSAIGSTVHVLTTTAPGTVLTIGPVAVSGGATTDTYGETWQGSGTVTNGKQIDSTSTLVLE